MFPGNGILSLFFSGVKTIFEGKKIRVLLVPEIKSTIIRRAYLLFMFWFFGGRRDIFNGNLLSEAHL